MAKKTSDATETAAKNEGPVSKIAISKIDVDFFRKEKENLLWNLKMQEIRARDRRFGANFGLIGDVEFNKDTEGKEIRKQYLAIDLNRWNLKGENTTQNRLIIRSFNDVVKNEAKDSKTGGGFQGGMEVNLIDSLMVSFAARKALPSFYLMVPDTDYMCQVVKEEALKDRYVFPLLPVADEPIRFFEMIGIIGAGRDFKIEEVGRKGTIAKIDEIVLNIGGRFEIEIYDEALQKHKTFPQMLALLCCYIKFNKEIEKIIEKLLKEIATDKKDEVGYRFIPNADDLELLKNPRYRK